MNSVLLPGPAWFGRGSCAHRRPAARIWHWQSWSFWRECRWFTAR